MLKKKALAEKGISLVRRIHTELLFLFYYIKNENLFETNITDYDNVMWVIHYSNMKVVLFDKIIKESLLFKKKVKESYII